MNSTLTHRRRFLGLSCGSCIALASPALAGAFKPIDIGPLKDLPDETISTKFVRHNFFLIRHDGRIFATIATCPHKGNYLMRDPKDPKRIICSGHDAEFDAQGKPVAGRVKTGLERFAISLDDRSHVKVDPDRRFPQARWNDKAAFVKP